MIIVGSLQFRIFYNSVNFWEFTNTEILDVLLYQHGCILTCFRCDRKLCLLVIDIEQITEASMRISKKDCSSPDIIVLWAEEF